MFNVFKIKNKGNNSRSDIRDSVYKIMNENEKELEKLFKTEDLDKIRKWFIEKVIRDIGIIGNSVVNIKLEIREMIKCWDFGKINNFYIEKVPMKYRNDINSMGGNYAIVKETPEGYKSYSRYFRSMLDDEINNKLGWDLIEYASLYDKEYAHGYAIRLMFSQFDNDETVSQKVADMVHKNNCFSWKRFKIRKLKQLKLWIEYNLYISKYS